MDAPEENSSQPITDEESLQATLNAISYVPGDEADSSYFQYFTDLCFDIELAKILQAGLSPGLRSDVCGVLCTAAFDGNILAMSVNYIFNTEVPYPSRYKYFHFVDQYHKLLLAGFDGPVLRYDDVADTGTDEQIALDNAAAQEFVGTIVLYVSFKDENLARRLLQALPGLDTPISWDLEMDLPQEEDTDSHHE